jgi:hypothetical protein
MTIAKCTRARVFLATDYSIRATDARKMGLHVFVLEGAVRVMNINAEDGERVMREMTSSGVRLCSAEELAA